MLCAHKRNHKALQSSDNMPGLCQSHTLPHSQSCAQHTLGTSSICTNLRDSLCTCLKSRADFVHSHLRTATLLDVWSIFYFPKLSCKSCKFLPQARTFLGWGCLFYAVGIERHENATSIGTVESSKILLQPSLIIMYSTFYMGMNSDTSPEQPSWDQRLRARECSCSSMPCKGQQLCLRSCHFLFKGSFHEWQFGSSLGHITKARFHPGPRDQ